MRISDWSSDVCSSDLDQPSRSRNIDALYGIVAEVMPARTTAAWIELLERADVPVMPMNEPEDLFDCPHLTAVGMFPEFDHPTEGPMRGIKVPVHFSKTTGGHHRSEEHTSELQPLMRISYAVFCLKKKQQN